jgi:hypothetical protein
MALQPAVGRLALVHLDLGHHLRAQTTLPHLSSASPRCECMSEIGVLHEHHPVLPARLCRWPATQKTRSPGAQLWK